MCRNCRVNRDTLTSKRGWMTSIPKRQSSALSLQMCKRERYLDALQLRFITNSSVRRALALFNARHVVPIGEDSVFCRCLLASVHIRGVWSESQCVSECTCAVVFAVRALCIRYSVSESTPGRLPSHSVRRKTFHTAANFSNCLPGEMAARLTTSGNRRFQGSIITSK